MPDRPSTSAPRIAARIALMLAAGAVVPFFLPRRPRVARRVLIRADREHVFPLINDLRNWPRWTAWNQREEIAYRYDGPVAGVGAMQHWRSRGHTGVLHVKQSLPDERIAYSLIMDDRFLIEGALGLQEIAPHQTVVTWVARWHGSGQPWTRYFDVLMMWWIGRDFSAGLENLRRLAETTAAPVPEPVG